jgi:hypothetical protein
MDAVLHVVSCGSASGGLRPDLDRFYAVGCFGGVSLSGLAAVLFDGAGETTLKHCGATFTTRS